MTEYKVMAKGRNDKRFHCYGHHTESYHADKNAESLARRLWARQVYMKNCPHVEFEQDMGAHIPICKLDRCPCCVQCLKNVLEPAEGVEA